MPELPMADRADVVLPPADANESSALDAALAHDDRDARREAVSAVVADHPTFLDGWGRLSVLARDDVERYACARVGYHRGLDALRGAGWGGTGYCRWVHPSNRGFLRCLAALRGAARAIGEVDEVDRIDAFLRDLDPEWDDSLVDQES